MRWCTLECWKPGCPLDSMYQLGLPWWKIRPVVLMYCPEFRHMWE